MAYGEKFRPAYLDAGYAVLEGAAPTQVASALLGVITKGLAAPGISKRFSAAPSVNAKPSIEFHSSVHPLLTGFHWGLTSLMEQVTGARLAPSYAYFRAYQKGDRCAVHSDRPACEHSLSLALGYADDELWNFDCGSRFYEFDDASKLRCAHDFGDEPFSSATLKPGDAIAYQGVNRRHGRITPNPNAWSAHAFFHWVDLDGAYREWAFDKSPPPAPCGFDFAGGEGFIAPRG